jgi:nicotinate-nucleotide adenylyltransferase
MSAKIGLFGGSFDPIHFGHINLALEMIEKRHLDEVWFIPTGVNPFKAGIPLTSAKHRLQMLKLAIKAIPACRILEVEIAKKFPCYTIDTLQEVIKNDKNSSLSSQFYLILGEDVIQCFDSWHEPKEIIQLVPLLIGSRQLEESGIYSESPEIATAIKKGLTQTRVMSISSTEIRERIRKSLYCKHLLPEEVLDYIYQHHIY